MGKVLREAMATVEMRPSSDGAANDTRREYGRPESDVDSRFPIQCPITAGKERRMDSAKVLP